MRSKKSEKTYVFIDSQNLNLGISKDIRRNEKLIYKGLKLDFEKFYKYLNDKFRSKKIFLFIGFIPENQQLYDVLKSYGYELIYKDTVKDNNGKPKGNVDAEIVLHSAAIEFKNYWISFLNIKDLYNLKNLNWNIRLSKNKKVGGVAQ